MKLRHPAIAFFTATALTAAVCLLPGFAAPWAECISLPALHILAFVGQRLPFSLLEWGAILFIISLIIVLLRRGFRALLKRACAALLFIVFAFSALWLPLYHAFEIPFYAASDAQLIASCETLIDQLNASVLDFSIPPDDLPAKFVLFPGWMRAIGISGFFSFPTGEALISPELSESALPFVAVHEAMHARGYAGEGEANIAAWEESMRLGGTYADSARLWALRYSMAALYEINPSAYASLIRRMSDDTLSHFRSVGGGTRIQPHSGSVQAAFSALGVGEASGNYEILAAYLASQMPL